MDLINLIREKSKFFENDECYQGLQAIITHIEIAERHFKKGKNGEEYFYTDVIYRTNQAFEGALKEAYKIISSKRQKKITSYEIEKFLENENKLKERVLSLFTNYRKEWRNKSAHDYKLYFSDQEAFLAIVSICAFINILLDQMIEAYGIKEGKEEAKKIDFSLHQDRDILETISELLIQFSTITPSKAKSQGKASLILNEREMIGMLYSYIGESKLGFEVFQEAILFSNTGYKSRIDLLVNKDDQRVIIEVKNLRGRNKELVSSGIQQVLNYLQVNQFTTGILYIPPIFSKSKMIVEDLDTKVGDASYKVRAIYPEFLSSQDRQDS
ncbi:MAG: hypothetical protein AAGK97_12360 [Bacteroidota bacterium]